MFWTRKGPTREEFNELASAFRLLQAEWLDMHEKLKRLYDRTRKRQEREDEIPGLETPADVKARLRDRVFGGRANGRPK